VEEGEFRSDLYYRLNVATLILPPLRDRKSDLPQLSEFFLDRANRRLGTDISSISAEAMEIFFNYDWPGNVRQFANAVERAAIFCTTAAITPAEVDQAFSNKQPAKETAASLPDSDLPLKQALIQYERYLIENALRRAGGTQTDAADNLGISAKNLWNKLKKHEIDPALFKG